MPPFLAAMLMYKLMGFTFAGGGPTDGGPAGADTSFTGAGCNRCNADTVQVLFNRFDRPFFVGSNILLDSMHE